ncbi:hypothetical protein SVAN01_11871 [Stagonosporopsis vannaccii]|nr:hypothetical protein SVAN01_11871 [Stagonosporopsis vannaccii]
MLKRSLELSLAAGAAGAGVLTLEMVLAGHGRLGTIGWGDGLAEPSGRPLSLGVDDLPRAPAGAFAFASRENRIDGLTFAPDEGHVR